MRDLVDPKLRNSALLVSHTQLANISSILANIEVAALYLSYIFEVLSTLIYCNLH